MEKNKQTSVDAVGGGGGVKSNEPMYEKKKLASGHTHNVEIAKTDKGKTSESISKQDSNSPKPLAAHIIQKEKERHGGGKLLYFHALR